DRRLAADVDRPGPRAGDRSQGLPLRRASRPLPGDLVRTGGVPAGLLPRTRVPDVADALLSREVARWQRRSGAVARRDGPLPPLPGTRVRADPTASRPARWQDGD